MSDLKIVIKKDEDCLKLKRKRKEKDIGDQENKKRKISSSSSSSSFKGKCPKASLNSKIDQSLTNKNASYELVVMKNPKYHRIFIDVLRLPPNIKKNKEIEVKNIPELIDDDPVYYDNLKKGTIIRIEDFTDQYKITVTCSVTCRVDKKKGMDNKDIKHLYVLVAFLSTNGKVDYGTLIYINPVTLKRYDTPITGFDTSNFYVQFTKMELSNINYYIGKENVKIEQFDRNIYITLPIPEIIKDIYFNTTKHNVEEIEDMGNRRFKAILPEDLNINEFHNIFIIVGENQHIIQIGENYSFHKINKKLKL